MSALVAYVRDVLVAHLGCSELADPITVFLDDEGKMCHSSHLNGTEIYASMLTFKEGRRVFADGENCRAVWEIAAGDYDSSGEWESIEEDADGEIGIAVGGMIDDYIEANEAEITKQEPIEFTIGTIAYKFMLQVNMEDSPQLKNESFEKVLGVELLRRRPDLAGTYLYGLNVYAQAAIIEAIEHLREKISEESNAL